MSETFLLWLCRSAVAGGGLLLLGWLLCRRQTQPQRQQRLAEWTVASALLTAGLAACPAWLLIPVPAAPRLVETTMEAVEPELLVLPLLPSEPPEVLIPAETVEIESVEVAEPRVSPGNWTLADGLLLGYLAVVSCLLIRWLGASLALTWLLWKSRPVPPRLAKLFAEMAGGLRCRLLVSERVRVPFSLGLFRRLIVLPANLAERGDETEWRMVLAHELTHLGRQDTRSLWLFAVAELVFFYLPWFWWLRRQTRLCQEYVADAAAVRWANHPADYAQFLLSWAGRPIAGSTGVSGTGSDLYRRVSMVLQPTNCLTRCKRSWLMGMVSGLLVLAILAGSLGVQVVTAAPEKPQDNKPAPAKKPANNPTDWEDFFTPLDQLDNLPEQFREQMKLLREHMQQMQQQLQQQGGGFGFQMQPFGQFNQFGAFPRALGNRQQRLGVQVRAPSATLVEQLDLPAGQGLVVEEVGANSPAAKAGIKPHDVLLEVDGKPVSNKPAELSRQLASIKANTAVDAVVLRKGRKETIKGLNLPEPRSEAQAAPLPGFGRFPMPNFGGGGFGGFGGGQGGSTSIQRNNNDFTAMHSVGQLKLTVKGTIDQGKAVISEVIVEKNGQKDTYTDVEKVPAEYRGKVKKLAEMSASGKLQMPFGDEV